MPHRTIDQVDQADVLIVPQSAIATTAYLQRTRVDEAKGLLERTTDAVEETCWAVGYDDPASFRRLFKRITEVTPGAYRRKFAGA